MPKYIVTKKYDNAIVFRYESDAQIIWDQFPESDYSYLIESNTPVNAEIASKFNSRRELTHLEFRSLFTQEEIEDIDEFQVSFESSIVFDKAAKKRIRTAYITYSTASFVCLDDPSTALGLGVYATIGLIAPYRIAEVLNG